MAKRILVTDDYPPALTIIRRALESEGFSVMTAGTGEECLLAVEAEKPDLLILDMMLPDMDGLEILRALRQKSATQLLPVVIITARKERPDVVDGWMGGADLYLTKPFSSGDLVAAVKHLLAAPLPR